MEKVDAGQSFEGVDGDGIVKQGFFAFGVGEDKGDGFMVGSGDGEQGFVIILGDGDVVGADSWVLFILKDGAGEDDKGFKCRMPNHALELQDWTRCRG